MQIVKLNRTLFQFWFAGLLGELVAVSPFMVGFVFEFFSMNLFYNSSLYRFFLQKEYYFFLMQLIIFLSFALPYFLLKNMWIDYFADDKYKKMIVQLIIILLIQGAHFLIPPHMKKIDTLILVLLFASWFRLIYLQSIFFFSSSFHSMNIPTTLSFFFISILITGLCILNFAPTFDLAPHNTLLLLLLITDFLIYLSTLKYLKDYSDLTRMSVKDIFTRYLLFTFLFLVFGLIIPILFILYNFFSHKISLQLIVPLILAGQISKNMLFLLSSYGVKEGNSNETA